MGDDKTRKVHDPLSELGAIASKGLKGEAALRQQLDLETALLEAVLRQMPAGVIVAEAPSGKVLLANNQLMHIRHQPFHAERVQQYAQWQGFHPSDMRPYEPEEWPLARSVTEGDVVTNEEMFILREDGTCGTVSVSSAPIRDRDGRIVAGVAILRDITHQRRLADEMHWMLRAVEQSASTVLITDRDGNIEYVNPKFSQLTGYSPKEVIGKNPRILKSGRTPAKEYRRLWETILAGGEWRGEMLNRKKDGELYWEWTSISPIRNAEGKITHFLAVKEDISERKRAEEFREEYVSLVSHDLRTPLTIIMGQGQWMARRLRDQGLEQEASGADVLVRNAKRMNGLIDEIVSSARLEAGQLELQLSETDLNVLVAEALERSTPREDRARVQLEAAKNGPLVRADRAQLERAVANLVSNALKYSPPNGQVTVNVMAAEGEGRVVVTDQGVGIAPDDLQYVFDRYYRAKTGQQTEGTGLGLYITRLIVTAHGGKVWAQSEMGRGSKFYISLPMLDQRGDSGQ